jgi:hypothetical protein
MISSVLLVLANKSHRHIGIDPISSLSKKQKVDQRSNVWPKNVIQRQNPSKTIVQAYLDQWCCPVSHLLASAVGSDIGNGPMMSHGVPCVSQWVSMGPVPNNHSGQNVQEDMPLEGACPWQLLASKISRPGNTNEIKRAHISKDKWRSSDPTSNWTCHQTSGTFCRSITAACTKKHSQ